MSQILKSGWELKDEADDLLKIVCPEQKAQVVIDLLTNIEQTTSKHDTFEPYNYALQTTGLAW